MLFYFTFKFKFFDLEVSETLEAKKPCAGTFYSLFRAEHHMNARLSQTQQQLRSTSNRGWSCLVTQVKAYYLWFTHRFTKVEGWKRPHWVWCIIPQEHVLKHRAKPRCAVSVSMTFEKACLSVLRMWVYNVFLYVVYPFRIGLWAAYESTEYRILGRLEAFQAGMFFPQDVGTVPSTIGPRLPMGIHTHLVASSMFFRVWSSLGSECWRHKYSAAAFAGNSVSHT